MMRSKIMIIFLIFIIIVLNLILYNSEQTSTKGQTFFLKLESSQTEVLPVYGNSISLIYEINGNYSQKLYSDMQSGLGQIVILIDESGEGRFVRFYDGKGVTSKEALIRYQKEEGENYIHLLPKSFFFAYQTESHPLLIPNLKPTGFTFCPILFSFYFFFFFFS